MTEWGVVAVIIALVGLFITVGKPIINLNSNIVALNQKVEQLLDGAEDTKVTLEKHETMLNAHSIRLHDLDGK